MKKTKDKISADTLRILFSVLAGMVSKILVKTPQKKYLFKDSKIRLFVDCVCVDGCPFPLNVDITIRKFEP